MKKQNRIKLLTLLSCLFYCRCTDTLIQEINTTTSTNSDILSRAKLIMHNYENTFSLPNILKRSDTITSRSIDLHYAIDAIPIWDEVWEEENGEENILFVPLQNSKELYSRIVVKEGNIGSNYFSKSFSRLLVRTKHGHTLAHVITYLPERHYAKNYWKALQTIGYHPEEANFHGTIIISELDGTLKHGIIYKNGVPIIRFTQSHQPNSTISQPNDEHCQHNHYNEQNRKIYEILGIKKTKPRILLDFYNGETTTLSYSRGNENDDLTCSFCGKSVDDCNCVTCEGEYIRCPNCGIPNIFCVCTSPEPLCPTCLNNPCICYHNNCRTCNTFPCICQSGGGGNSGVGSGSGNSSIPSSTAPNAERSFINAAMSQEDWEKLESMLMKIKEDCLGETLYNELVKTLQVNPINFAFTSYREGSYNPSTHVLLVDSTLNSNVLLHEMVHAYRWQKNPDVNSWNSSTLNAEIEAHYAQYLYLKRNKDEFDDSLWGNDKTKFNKRLLSIVNLYKLLGNKSIVKPIYNENSEIDEETTMAVFETFWDNTVVPSWQEDLQYGDYVYSKEQNFLQMITNLVILTQKC